MGKRAAAALRRLHERRRELGGEAAREKRELLSVLERARLARTEDVLGLHDLLCFMRAYPDDRSVLAAVVRMLESFDERTDLRRHRDVLADTGIAGTALHESFYWPTADWFCRRWPEHLSIDWESVEDTSKLDDALYAMLEEHELLAYDGAAHSLRETLDILKAPAETDATYLLTAARRPSTDTLMLEQVFDGLELPLRLAPGRDTPSRTRAVFPTPPVTYQAEALTRPSGIVRERIGLEPRSVRQLTAREGKRLVELGRGALISRGRDLFAFMHADARDAFLVDMGDGLCYAGMGLPPERRHLLYGQYIFLILKNGVPVGYTQSCVLFRSAEINFNVFPCFRDGEASKYLTGALAVARSLFGADTFGINTQQLGEGNPDALKTGAWWFYHKHGFRPAGAKLRPIIQRELRSKSKNPRHRSSIATLATLSEEPIFLSLGRVRRDVIGQVDLSRVGEVVARHVGRHFGVSGRRAAKACGAEAARLLGVRSQRSWSRAERDAWNRWGPLIVSLPGLGRWTREQKRALANIARSKGGVRELDYIRRVHEHDRLQKAIVSMAKR